MYREFQSTGTEERELHFPSKYYLLLNSAFKPKNNNKPTLCFHRKLCTVLNVI